jgi:hypothetical protein
LSIKITISVIAILVTLPIVAAFRRVLPKRPAGALHLRSFAQDRDTGAVRTELQAALGRRFRLSGIRDPRRRWPKIIGHLLVIAFVFRYATPKYMNLEAGDDWKRRLWRSLGDARCAVIDVTTLTPAVVGEMRLCHRCLGLNRILFVTDPARSADEWRERIDQALRRVPEPEQIRLAVWDHSRQGRAAFVHTVSQFADQVPAAPAGFRPEAAELAEDDSLESEPTGGLSGVWVEVVLGFGFATIVTTALDALIHLEALGAVRLVFFIPVFAILLTSAYQFLVYLIDCGSARERVLATVSMTLVLVPLGALIPFLLIVTANVREAAEREISRNNLKQIALAFHHDEGTYNEFPGPNAPARWVPSSARPPKGPPPPVSWRVLLLPYLEQDGLFRQYRLGEPWDGPNNIKLLEHMPKVYRHPAAKDTPRGTPTSACS